ncbi:MAG: hypothetical protein LLG21_05305 [Euryarchaeota archaeon]|nr:hypothetical protein [Euryarchaeota archaeon]
MNARDMRQYENFRRQLGPVPRPGLMVLDVRTTQFVVVELVLLKALIGDGNPGLFVSVDRPHQYMVHLLDMHGIEHTSVTFIDTVSQFAATDTCRQARVGFFKGPNNIDMLPSALREWSSKDQGFDLAQCRFALIDNISNLLTFNGHEKVQRFIREFNDLLGDRAAVVLVIDRQRNPNLYHSVLAMGGTELRLEAEACDGSGEGSYMDGGTDGKRGIDRGRQ